MGQGMEWRVFRLLAGLLHETEELQFEQTSHSFAILRFIRLHCLHNVSIIAASGSGASRMMDSILFHESTDHEQLLRFTLPLADLLSHRLDTLLCRLLNHS